MPFAADEQLVELGQGGATGNLIDVSVDLTSALVLRTVWATERRSQRLCAPALQVFGLVIGVTRRQALGAQMGALVARNLGEHSLVGY